MSKIVQQQQIYARVYEKNFKPMTGKAPHVLKRATKWRNSKKAMSLEYRSAPVGGIKLKANLVISSLSNIDTLNQSFVRAARAAVCVVGVCFLCTLPRF